MSATDLLENGLLDLLFNNTALANIGDAGGLQPSAGAGSWYVSLHTASAGETGSQITNEAGYISYAREAVARSTAGWTVTNNTCDNAAAITFTTASGGSETETDFGLGSASSGTGNLHIIGTLNSSLAVSNGITPEFAIGALDITIDP